MARLKLDPKADRDSCPIVGCDANVEGYESMEDDGVGICAYATCSNRHTWREDYVLAYRVRHESKQQVKFPAADANDSGASKLEAL